MNFLFTIFLIFAASGCATAPSVTVAPTRVNMGATTIRERIFEPGVFAWPVEGAIISNFGSKVDRILNKGIDIKAPEGTSVRAARAGRVVYCDSYLKGFGKTIIIDHGNGYQTVYANNSEMLTSVGTPVEKGDIIARVGRTGRAKTAGLHFEIRRDGRAENPELYLRRG